MEQTSPSAAFAQLLDASQRPIYAVDTRHAIVYCNAALADWLGLERRRIVGRHVEYHSEAASGGRPRDAAGPLTDLCPPPKALAGDACVGAVGCAARDGRLVHRRAEFVPLGTVNPTAANGTTSGPANHGGVLVLLATTDMLPEELSAEIADEPTGDELHRAIRRFRRGQAAKYAIETLLGVSTEMRKVQAQVVAAAASGANVLIRGRRGSGRAHIGRAIHYQSADATGKFVPIDCAATSEDSLRRTLDSFRDAGAVKGTSTLLLLHLDRLPTPLQSQLLAELADPHPGVRFIATLTHSAAEEMPGIHPQLLAALSTITIDVPPLAERLDDLPLLAQFFLEAANRGTAKQIGSLRPDALDLMALYRWPGELDELRTVIAAAHAACTSHEISPNDLPALIHHAAKAAALPRRFVEKIVLEDLLAEIEREIVTRALAQAGGNKSAAADLLGMTRPRLYRRLVQLGLATETAEGESQ